MKDSNYFLYEDEKTGEKFIAKNFDCLKMLLYHLGSVKSEKHIRHCYNQIGVIDVSNMCLTYFLENSHVVNMLREYIEKQKN